MTQITQRDVALADCLPLIEEQLKLGSSVEITAHGTSMLPMLHDSSVTISPKPERLKLLDLPFYRRANGQFVLHRVVRINKDGSYGMCGDNQTLIESPITHDQIIGVVTAFDWNGKNTPCDDKEYLHYAKKRVKSQKRRGVYLRFRGLIGRILRKLHLRK